MELITLRVISIRQETSDTKSFCLEPVNGQVLDYLPGQFLTLIFPGKLSEERRSYSISSAAFLSEPLTITVKRIDNGAFSRYLFDQVKVGSTLQSIGVAGFFQLPAQIEKENTFLFLAAGSGITPMLPMINALLHQTSNEIRLLYSNRNEESTIFRVLLIELRAKFPARFEIVWLNSDSKNLMEARLTKVYLSNYIRQWINDKKNSSLFYLCGPKDYMQMASITLLAAGIPSTNIRKEIFDTTKMIVKELPPDTDQHLATLKINGTERAISVQYPETILEGAKREGIMLPYSCEAGKCGTCVASCTHGRVWMSYNEVLVEKELLHGRVLTCTGYAVGGDVTIAYDQ